jgi:hypothetical protein
MNDATASLRKSVYLLIGTVGVAVMIAKIVGAENVYEPSRYAPATEANFGFDREGKPTRTWPTTRPEPSMTFSSNDRSRWATIKALVDNGTYEIGRRSNFESTNPPFEDKGIIFDDGFQSLDKVMNPATGVYYSSKPPLLSTVLAGEYWLLKKTLNWSIDRDRWPVMATILMTVNVLPFVLYLILLVKLIETYGTTDFGKLFAFTLAAVGTFLTTFSLTLNNHSPAAYAVLFAVYPLLMKRDSALALFQVGFFAGLAAALELPAAAFTAAVILPLLWMRPKQTMLFAVPGLLIVVAAWFACNYAALGKFMPAYGDFGGPWYDYPGSYWKKFELQRAGTFVPGIDFNQEGTRIYAFHLAFGHHGWFSLTPAFLAAGVGLVMLAMRSGADIAHLVKRVPLTPNPSPAEGEGSQQRPFTFPLLATMTLVVSITVFAFYLTRTSSYNYGGNTSGPRWLFWLIPLWILGSLPAFDALARTRFRQFIAALLLGFSVLSVFYPAWNPWRNPWILQLLERTGTVNYDVKPK